MMDGGVAALDELCKESDDTASESSTSAGEQPGAGLLTIQIKAGGGTLIMRDVAETERSEATMFLSSLRVRWAEALEELLALEKSSTALVESWRAYETVSSTCFVFILLPNILPRLFFLGSFVLHCHFIYGEMRYT